MLKTYLGEAHFPLPFKLSLSHDLSLLFVKLCCIICLLIPQWTRFWSWSVLFFSSIKHSEFFFSGWNDILWICCYLSRFVFVPFMNLHLTCYRVTKDAWTSIVLCGEQFWQKETQTLWHLCLQTLTYECVRSHKEQQPKSSFTFWIHLLSASQVSCAFHSKGFCLRDSLTPELSCPEGHIPGWVSEHHTVTMWCSQCGHVAGGSHEWGLCVAWPTFAQVSIFILYVLNCTLWCLYSAEIIGLTRQGFVPSSTQYSVLFRSALLTESSCTVHLRPQLPVMEGCPHTDSPTKTTILLLNFTCSALRVSSDSTINKVEQTSDPQVLSAATETSRQKHQGNLCLEVTSLHNQNGIIILLSWTFQNWAKQYGAKMFGHISRKNRIRGPSFK